MLRLRRRPGDGYVSSLRISETWFMNSADHVADETVVNGAQSIYKDQFGIGGDSYRDTWLLGLTNAAPYLCCAVLGCCAFPPLPVFKTPTLTVLKQG